MYIFHKDVCGRMSQVSQLILRRTNPDLLRATLTLRSLFLVGKMLIYSNSDYQKLHTTHFENGYGRLNFL